MATEFKYALPVEQTNWRVNGESNTVLRWEYDDGRAGLLSLYDKGKKQQWDAAERIDWTQDLDPENPMVLPDQAIGIYGTDIWNKMTKKEQANFRRHGQAWQISQFLHGEQGALICTAKIVQQVPNVDSKFYAATQVMDEARHVEAYSRLLHDKFELAYPITPPLRALLEDVIRDSRWDFTYLGMQVLIEGLALAAFQRLRDQAGNPLAAAVNAYVMQDEARHVAFGRLALRDYYPNLTEHERGEREEFVVEACYHMRDRFLSEELWESVGLPKKECVEITQNSPAMQYFRGRLFSRIVPTIKDIGLWGEKVQKAYADMGVLDLANLDSAALLEQDQRVAEEFDAGRAHQQSGVAAQ
ncbi:MAG TPA: ferritin-like domain-containing protein [Candidatus Cybelea sp.]|nr:ferritin-like domain-containing protein [Candidatus Cybelea sp.]